MNPKYIRTSLVTGISGLILQTACYALLKTFAARARAHIPVPPEWLVYALVVGVLAGSILLILALCDFAKAKGYSGLLGVLLGFCSCIGLLVLVLLPDRTKE